MNRTYFTAALLCVAACFAVCIQTSLANVIVAQHLGMTDPLSESWAKIDVNEGAVCAAYDDEGTPMWEVASTYGNGSMYVQDASTAELTAMQTYGWRLVATVKVPEYSKVPAHSRAIIVYDGVRNYYLKFGTEEYNQRVQWEAGENSGFATLIGDGSYSYHTYEIRVAPGAASASVYADGKLLATNWTGYAFGEAHNVFFGNVSSIAGTCDYAEVTLTHGVSSRLGDVDGNGAVDENDAAVLAEYWLSGPDLTWVQGDFNGDGWVNDIDAAILATNWSPAAAQSSVPEPGAAVMLLAGVVAWFVYNVRGRRK